jgi:hypothetical protein
VQFNDFDIPKKIPIKGKIEFTVNGDRVVLDNMKPQTDVWYNITEWKDVAESMHCYATLMIPHIHLDKGWIRVEHKVSDPYNNDFGKTFFGEGPARQEFGRLVIDITVPAEGDITEFDENGERRTVVRKGQRTNRLDTIDQAEKRVKEEFDRIFGKGYKLRRYG